MPWSAQFLKLTVGIIIVRFSHVTMFAKQILLGTFSERGHQQYNNTTRIIRHKNDAKATSYIKIGPAIS